MKILIVDDHAINRKLLRMQLEAAGHRVLEAAHGIEALEILDRESVDGVVSDILMPGMDGFRLCLEIRKRKNIAKLPFVLYTATFKTPEDRELAQTVGADQYLTKPSTVREIIGALEHAMQKTRDRIAVSAARHDESYVLKQYNEALVRKLATQNLELEGALKNLQIAHDSKQESERRFRAIFDHAGVGIGMRPAHDRKLPWVQVNDHFCKLLGYTRDELLKLSTVDITPADGQASAISDNQRLLSDDTAGYSREKEIIRKDGRRIWVLLTVAPLPGPDGRPASMISTYQDISERKAAEDKVRRLSRVRAVLSGIYAVIVRAGNRQELLDEACRITVEHGGFGIAWIGKYDPATLDVTPVAWAGLGAKEYLGSTKSTARGDLPQGQGAVGRAIRERRPVFSNDISTETGVGSVRRAEALRRGYRSVIVLPLIVDGAVTAIFSMFAKESNYFDDEEVKLLAELAGNISFALEHMARQEKLDKLSRIRAVLGNINAAIVRIHDKQRLLEETCRIAVEQGQLGSAWIGSLDPVTLDITPVAWAGEGSEEIHTTRSTARDDPPRGQGPVGRAARERRAVCNNDLLLRSFGSPRRDAVLKLGFRSMIALPLIEGDKVVGTLTLYAREPGFFDEAEVALLTELAGNVSFALEHMARQLKLDKLSRIRAISSEINAAIVRVRERKALLKETCRIASEQGGFEMVWIGAIDHEKQAIEPVCWTGFSEEIAHRVNWESIGAAQGTLSEAIRTRKAAVRDNIESEIPVGRMRGEALKQGCRSTVSLPLVVDDRVVALVSLFAAGTGYFDKDELALLDEVASNISFALEHIEREEKFARLTRIEAVTGSISGLIVRARDRDELFREACRIAVDEGRFRMSLIGIVDRSTMKVVPVATAGKDEELLASIKGILSSSENAPKTMIARAIGEKKTVVSNDSQNDSRVLFGKKYAESGVRSMAVLPLIVSDEAVGVLALYADETGFFDDEEMKLLTELTGNIAFAIDHFAKQERLDFLAYYDALTGLANRTLFLERVAQSIRSADSGGHKLALFLIDLDRFKNINDSLGRQAGDALLKQVAEWMTHNLGDASLLARVDADHFAVLLPEVKQEGDVARLIEKSMGAFMGHPFRVRDAVFRISAKIGVALFPDDGADADTLFRNAEAALKKAKSSGERYLFHTQKMTEAVAGKYALENQLREALDKGEFVLHYQPKVCLATGAVCGLEALIRWQKPGVGLMAPGAFIPLLEETGLILGVGKWALSKALAQHREWTARGIAAPRIAVNVSAIQLQQKDFSDVVTGAMQAQGGDPDALELEVTESLLMQDVQDSIRTLSILRALGIHIAMDDFGTGYSSLSYIARLPINSVKIDRSFINEMASSPQDMSIVTTIIALAHSLNLRVVAEGVEAEAQSKLLKLLKCDEAQGYLYSKPLPAAEIEPLLRALESEASEPERV